MAAARIQRVADVGKVSVDMAIEKLPKLADSQLKRFLRFRRNSGDLIRNRRRSMILASGRLFHDQMRICSAEAERTDCGAPGAMPVRFPVAKPYVDVKRATVETN